MERKPHFYVSRKNPLIWLMVLCMIGSAVARFLIVGVKGSNLWCQIVLPVAASLLFVLIVLLAGKEHFYETAIPIWLMNLYYVFVFEAVDFGYVDALITMLYVVALLFIAIFYTQITAGKTGSAWLLIPALLVPLAALLYLNRAAILSQHFTQIGRAHV